MKIDTKSRHACMTDSLNVNDFYNFIEPYLMRYYFICSKFKCHFNLLYGVRLLIEKAERKQKWMYIIFRLIRLKRVAML